MKYRIYKVLAVAVPPTPEDVSRPPDEAEFCHYPQPHTEVSSWESLTLAGLHELQRAMRMLAKKFFSIPMSRLDFGAGLDQIQAALEFYGNPDFIANPNKFFRRPESEPQICLSSPHVLSHGEVIDFSFRSNFSPLFQPFHELYYSRNENRTAHARMWRHPKGKSLGSIIAIHGWFMGDQRLNALALVPGFFYRLGLDVILYELPYHGRRAPCGRQTSLFPSSDIACTNEAMSQAIYDLRSIAMWLHEKESKPIGVTGVSLGGYAAALWASLDKIDFVIPMLPLVSMGDLAFRILSDLKEQDSEAAKGLSALSEEDLGRAYALHSPLSYKPKVSPHRRMIIAGTSDSIIPSSQPHDLWLHWKKPKIYWYSGDHVGQLFEETALNEVHGFLSSLHLAWPEPLNVTG